MAGAEIHAEIERIQVPQTDSTNIEALRRVAGGHAPPFWITAGRQTAGKGRRRRAWVSDPGNLFASLVYPVCDLPPRTDKLPLVAAVAVRETVAAFTGAGNAIAIKWPNDILVDGRKISGILIEQHQIGATAILVAGVGINIASRPEIASYPTACLADIGAVVAPDPVWRELAACFAKWLAVWRGRDGFAAVRQEWLRHAAGMGETIIVTDEKSSRTGIFSTLDEQGYLLLRHGDGRIERISCGDVILNLSGY